MSVVIALILVAVLGILLGTGLALVRSRKQRDATLLEPPPGAAGVPEAVKDDVARHKAELEAQIEAEEATAQTGVEVDEALAAAVEDALAPPTVEVPEAPVKPRFRDRLGKARTLLGGYVGSILSREKIDPQTWDELEEALIRADVGIEPTTELLDQLAGPGQGARASPTARELLELAQGRAQAAALAASTSTCTWPTPPRRCGSSSASTASARPPPSARSASARSPTGARS